MIVPLDEERRLGGEAALVLVHQVVGEVAAELIQGLGHLGLGLGGHVLPDRAVVQRDLRLQRTVGIDLVAAVDEEIRIVTPHRLIQAIATPFRIDAPALPGLVAREGEGDGTAVARGRAQPADQRRAFDAPVG